MSIVYDFGDVNQRLLGDDWWQPRAPKPKQVELPVDPAPWQTATVSVPQHWRLRNVPLPPPPPQDVARITVERLLTMSDETFHQLLDRASPAELCKLMGGEMGEDLVIGCEVHG
jgi:hypothetical protein